jgi:peptidoglycan/LPS O-acetylase OafA/YrhL
MTARNQLPAERGHLDALDGLRAVAAFIVVVFHVGFITADLMTASGGWRIVAHGDVGVPIFFALSGFLLYRPWARRTLLGGNTPGVRIYLWRRALRILPAYWAVVAIALPAFNGARAEDIGTWVQWLTLTNIYDLDPWWTGTGPAGLGQMWSLSTEVAFYLALPLIATALTAYATYRGPDVNARAKRLLWALGMLSLVSYAWIATTHNVDGGNYYELWLPRSICWFTVGMVLTVLSEWSRAEPDSPDGPIGRLCRTIGSMPGVCWLVAVAAWGLVATPLAGPAYPAPPSMLQAEMKTFLYMVIAAGLVAPAAFQPKSPTLTNAVLGNAAMRFFGRISYGVFLWQFVVIYAWYRLTDRPYWAHDFWLVITVVLFGTVAAATVSYYVLERPLQRLKGRSTRWAVTLPDRLPLEPPPPRALPSAVPTPAVDTRTGRWQRGS